MAGAERQRRLDLDADAVRRNAGAIMRAVNDEAAGVDRLEPGEAFAHPIRRHEPSKRNAWRRGPGRRGDQRAHRFPSGRLAK